MPWTCGPSPDPAVPSQDTTREPKEAHLSAMLTHESLSTWTVVIGVALGTLGISYLCLGKSTHHVPPGPRRYPVIGNLLNFPMQGWGKIFPEWHKKHGVHKHSQQSCSFTIPVLVPGNLVYANLMGMPVFIIGDREIAEELLNARGRISANRPTNVLFKELCVTFPRCELIVDNCLEWDGTSGLFL